VCWELESDASGDDVFGNWHDQSEMAMAPTALGGGDSTCIGIQLLGQPVVSGGVSGCADDWCKAQMQEGEHCGCD